MKKKLVLLVMCMIALSAMCGIAMATTYTHGVETTNSSTYDDRTTTWTPAANRDITLKVDCQIKATSSAAYMRYVVPDMLQGTSYDTARGRVWSDKKGEKYTEWCTFDNPSGEISRKYSSLYTFYVEIKND